MTDTTLTLAMQPAQPRKRKLDISTLILIGVGLGILTGLFFGEVATNLKFVGDAFIKLLQMTILPYVVVTIITGFGTLSMASAKKMAINGGLFLLIFWGMALFAVMVMSMAYPALTSATFFSASQITTAKEQSLVDVFVTSNFFESLAKGTVPAVVVFSILFGVVLIKIDGKENLLRTLETVKSAFESISGFVFKLSPIGIFALTANAAGTLKIEELSRLQAHFATYMVGTGLMTVVILPFIVTRLVGLKYGRVMSAIRSALILAFTSGNAFITLPLVERAVKELYADRPEAAKHVRESNVVIPVVFNFPTIGTVFHLLFILFTGWIYAKPLGIGEHIKLAVVGLLNLFGGSYVTIPYLLEMFKLPSDAFELFLLARIGTDTFESALDVMSIFTLTLLYMGLASGLLRRKWKNLIFTAVASGGLLIAGAFAVHSVLSWTMDSVISQKDVLKQMAISNPVPYEVKYAKFVPSGPASGDDLLTDIRRRGVLRVGYNADSLPFAFFNEKKELVGYDISRAHDLARHLGVRIEFYPFSYSEIVQDLKSGAIDIAMSSISINAERMREIDYSIPYMQLHLGFVVPDYMRKQFHSKADMMKLGPLHVVDMTGSAYIPLLKAYMPSVKISETDRLEDFFEGKTGAVALLSSAEQGAALTLLYPFYKVVIPEEPIGDDFMAYPIARGNSEFLNFVNTWLTTAKLSDKAQNEYNYWILGKDPKLVKPRWSVMRDVLHWVD